MRSIYLRVLLTAAVLVAAALAAATAGPAAGPQRVISDTVTAAEQEYWTPVATRRKMFLFQQSGG